MNGPRRDVREIETESTLGPPSPEPGVLVVAARPDPDISTAILNNGYRVLHAADLLAVLKALQRQRLACVVLDSRHSAMDALELVINVRDTDQHLPVCIVGAELPQDQLPALEGQHDVVRLPGQDGHRQLFEFLRGSR